MKQLSFSDLELNLNRSKKTRREVQSDKINRIVDWVKVEALLSRSDQTSKQGGRKPIPVLIKAQMLFVQYLYNLSDPALEDQLYGQEIFSAFCRAGFLTANS